MLETQRTGKLSQIVCLQDIYCFSWLLKFQETTCPEKLVEKKMKERNSRLKPGQGLDNS